MLAVELLLAGVGSVSGDVTVAVLAIVVPLAAVLLTISAIVALAPFASVPRLHVTVVVPEHEPWLGVADWKVTFAGRTSVTTTLDALCGPAFVTVIV